MAGLTGKTIAATYESLLKVSTSDNANLVADTQKDIVDGLDNVSALKLATNRATITLGETADDNFLITNSSTASNIFVVEGDSDSASGRVGIGTATPGAKFEIEQGSSDGAIAFLIDNNDTDKVAMSIEAANIDADVIDISADAVTTAKVIDITADALTSGSMLYLDDNSASTTARNCVSIIQNNDAALDATALLVQSDGGGTGMKIDKNYPAALVAADTITGLHIDFDHTVPSSGTATQTDIGIDLDVNSATLGTSTTYGMDIDVVGATSGTHTVVGLAVDVGSADTNYAALFNGGNVGIGATSPDTFLHIRTTASTTTYTTDAVIANMVGSGLMLHIENYANVVDDILAGIEFSAYNAKAAIACAYDATNNASLIFGTSEASDTIKEKMRILGSGFVSIGCIPSALCHIKNDADHLSATVHALIVEDTHATVDAGDVLARFDYSGDADVHTALAKFISFHDSGGEIGYVATSSDGVISVDILGSDVRLKTDIQDTSLEGLNTINALKIRDFKWGDKANPNLTGKQIIGGWVADEVYEVYPKAVHGKPGQMMDVKDEEGNKTGEKVMNPMGLSASQFISVMMKAIQELSAKVTALESASNGN